MKVVRDIWGNKTRTLLVVLSIAVGIFAIGTITGTKQLLAREMNQAFSAIRPPHAILWTSPFDLELVDTVRRTKGVQAAEARRVTELRVQVGPDEWKKLELTVIPDFRNITVGQIRPVSGTWPPRPNEVLIERAAISFLRTKTGEKLVVETPDRKHRELTVGGIVHDIDQFPTPLAGRAYGYITLDTLEQLGVAPQYTQLTLRLDEELPGQDQVEAVIKQVKSKVEKTGLTVYSEYIPTPGKHPADDAIQTVMLILGVLGFISLLASGFLVVNTVNAILAQNIRLIGMMKAVGARTSQIIGLYLTLVMSYALLAILVGVPLGALGAWGLSTFMAGMINFDIVDVRIPTSVLALEAAVGVLVPLLSALVPVIAGARITVREAISEHGAGSVRRQRGLINRLLERIHFLSRPLLISLRNTFRRKGRLALTMMTLTLAGAMFIGVFSVRDSLLLTIDDAVKYWNYDIDVDMRRAYRNEELERVALQVPGVSRVESWAFRRATRKRPDGKEGPEITMVAPPAETDMLKPTVLEGRWLLPEDENALVVNTTLLKDEADIAIGDAITLKIGDRETTWQVVGKVRGVLSGRLAYANYAYLSQLINQPGRSEGIRVAVDPNSPTGPEGVAKELKRRLDEAGLSVASIETMDSIKKRVEIQFNLIVVLMGAMAILLAIVGGLGLAGTMSINVLERTREIGVMRAIGASTGAMLRIFMTEGVLITLISCMLSTMVALPISKLLSNAVGMVFMQAPLSYKFSVAGLLLWIALATVIALASSFLPSWRAARLTVRDVLAYE